jgi:hypothetical protein
MEQATGILNLPSPWNVIGTVAALLLIGTFLYRMFKKEWWWEHLKRQAK